MLRKKDYYKQQSVCGKFAGKRSVRGKNKVLAMLLMIVMVFSLIPATAFADDGGVTRASDNPVTGIPVTEIKTGDESNFTQFDMSVTDTNSTLVYSSGDWGLYEAVDFRKIEVKEPGLLYFIYDSHWKNEYYMHYGLYKDNKHEKSADGGGYEGLESLGLGTGLKDRGYAVQPGTYYLILWGTWGKDIGEGWPPSQRYDFKVSSYFISAKEKTLSDGTWAVIPFPEQYESQPDGYFDFEESEHVDYWMKCRQKFISSIDGYISIEIDGRILGYVTLQDSDKKDIYRELYDDDIQRKEAYIFPVEKGKTYYLETDACSDSDLFRIKYTQMQKLPDDYDLNHSLDCVVTLDTNGGSELEWATRLPGYGGTVGGLFSDPTRDGYVFDGWYLGDKKWDLENDPVYHNITLTAHWKPATVNVIFDSNGGSNVAKQTVTNGQKAIAPASPIRSGYTFDGWYYGNKKWDFGVDVVTSDITLTAHWKPVTTPPASNPDKPIVKVPGKGASLKSGKTTYKVTKSGKTGGTVTYTKTSSTASKVSVPATVKIGGISYKVTSIANNAFKGNRKLTKVNVGRNVTSIGTNAFANCPKLTKVTIGSNVTSVGVKAFANCPKLTKVTIPAKVKKIGKQAFTGCKKLTTITIKSTKLTKKNVAAKAFSGISTKTTIKVPKSKVKAYKTLFRSKGLSKKVKVKK